MRRLVLYLILVLFAVNVIPSSAQCVEGGPAFPVGEELKYSAYYNWGLIWVRAGVATFSVGEEKGNYKFTVVADNLPRWEWLYSLHSYHKAVMTKHFEPLYMESSTTENGFWSKEHYRYDGNHIYKTYMNKIEPKGGSKTLNRPNCSWDIIHAVYVARSMNVREYGVGKSIPFHVMFNDSVYTIYGKILKEEMIENRNGREYNCLKCSATVVSGTMFEEGEPVYVWITNDERQIPILVESKISVGSVKVYLD
ncbi:MAG TPA: DUF3108 domain-containing protein [Paludibacteraceae bacterium]|jgi:hypothetical protein|nr:DUF3108 domain-containing protein [Paludibacteraceae bacterium]HOU68145.1 DUF3108 domain-containing protein [Paludibacteraceae bacterium]HPH63037.1 DUF3108 domain-containing protein [Paludibacteraceae bacterium]HQF50045.1 DUF3108 domain-containing protein [Paludibacteraceae bacterium]